MCLLHCRTYKRVMEEAGMLGSFIRLVDYMMVEALVDRTVGTVEELVAMLDAPHQSTDKTHKVCCCSTHTLHLFTAVSTSCSSRSELLPITMLQCIHTAMLQAS